MYKFNAFNNDINTMAFFNCLPMFFYNYSHHSFAPRHGRRHLLYFFMILSYYIIAYIVSKS